MNISEKVAYLKGLAEGLVASPNTKEGKLLTGILDVLGDVAKSLREAEEAQGNLFVYAEELDEDLGALEKAFLNRRGAADSGGKNTARIAGAAVAVVGGNEFYDEDEDAYEDFGDLEGSAKINCRSCGELLLFDLDDIEDGGAVSCPECGAEISVVGAFSSDGCSSGCGGCNTGAHDGETVEAVE